jgi:head-tail adaptor
MIGYNKSEIVGKMRERVILQNRIITQSDSGFQSEIYSDIGIYWSKIEYKTGFEEEDADKLTNQQKINITLRYNILVNVNSRFVYRNELYQVEKVEYSDDRRFMICVCVWRSSYTSIYAGSIFCSASLLAQSSLSAALMRVIKYQASLNAFGSVSADISFVQKVASSLNANASLSGDINFVQKAQANLSALASLSGDINFVQKAQASLLTSASVTGNITIPKTFNASLLATGTTTANLTVNAPSAFDADAAAFFARVTTAGGTLSATEQNAVNTLVISLKADGIWTKMKAIYPMVGASAAACAQNLKSSSFTGTFSSGWTFASTGAKPNGTSAFMDTNLPNNTMSQNSLTISTYLRTNNNTGASFCDIACWNGIFGSSIYSSVGLFVKINNNSTNQISRAVINSIGFYINIRTSATEVVYQKNLTQTTILNNSTNLLTSNYIIARTGNFNGEFSPRETALVGIGDGLSNTEAINYYTHVQAFQTTLNRQINP